MFSYEGGLLIAFFFWLFQSAVMLISINSTFEHNLNRIGRRLSWLTLQTKILTTTDVERPWWKSVLKYLLIVAFGLPWIFLSWVYVVWGLGVFIYTKSKDFGAPQSVREYRWKMRNVDLTFDQIIKMLMQLNDNAEAFEDYRAEFIHDMRDRGLQAPSI